MLKGCDSAPHGWCFTDGVMTSTSRLRVVAAIVNNHNTAHVNGSAGNAACAREDIAPETEECADWIIGAYASTLQEAQLAACAYPIEEFEPTSVSCTYNCIAPFVRCGDRCVDPSKQTCTSAVPGPSRKREFKDCEAGKATCPVATGWKCVETMTDIDSCGGCPGSGTRCRSLPGAKEVSCVRGECIIEECYDGLRLQDNMCHSKQW